ncbi:unnamed protein product, partial [Ectocarpus sp. 12 AP-2014]
TSDGAEPSADKGQQSSVTGAARQCSSANSSPVRSKLRKAIAEEPRSGPGSERNRSQGTNRSSGVARVLTRGASDGCIDSSSSNRGNNKSNPAFVREIMQPMESATSVAAACEATVADLSHISGTSLRRKTFEAVPEDEAVSSGGGDCGVATVSGEDGSSDSTENELPSTAKKEVTFLCQDDSTNNASAAGTNEKQGAAEAGTALAALGLVST